MQSTQNVHLLMLLLNGTCATLNRDRKMYRSNLLLVWLEEDDCCDCELLDCDCSCHELLDEELCELLFDDCH